jgi:prolipoprotein diacylglyceryltransferase
MGSLSVPLNEIAIFSIILLACCLPAAKFLAALIERKSSTFTIGGAAFLGLLLAPGLILALNATQDQVSAVRLPFLPTLGALAIAYAFGEGTGRLACISFGCCYGNPLTASSGWLKAIFRRCHFVFFGPTKKISYEAALEAVPVVPIQAITAVVFIVCGFTGLSLFFNGAMTAAFLLTACSTQLWRLVSETWRADYRGMGRWSVYQILALAGIAYSVALVLYSPAQEAVHPELLVGIGQVWTPGCIIGLQLLWLIVFWSTGKSRVTRARISLAVVRDRI